MVSFNYCETHGDTKQAINDYLKQYTILHAIQDIYDGWRLLSGETIKKSFRWIFPEKIYEQITNPEGDFTGFEDHELNPTCRRHVLAKENLPKDLTIERSANVNNAFDTKVDDLLIAFQKNNPTHLKFTKNAIVEDILQNPGPKDDDLENIMLEELGVQYHDTNNICEDMFEEDTSSLPPVYQLTERDMVHDYLKKINALKKHDVLYTVMTHHEKEYQHDLLKQIENLTIKCFQRASNEPLTLGNDTQEDLAVPSTSGVTSTVNRTTTVQEREPLAYGTENTTYLDSVVNVLYSGDSLPALEDTTMDHEVPDTMEHEVQDPMEHEVQETMEHEVEDQDIPLLNLDRPETEVTVFRALNETEQEEQKQKKKFGKFARFEKESNESDLDEEK